MGTKHVFGCEELVWDNQANQAANHSQLCRCLDVEDSILIRIKDQPSGGPCQHGPCTTRATVRVSLSTFVLA
jgi:hypothetical protein